MKTLTTLDLPTKEFMRVVTNVGLVAQKDPIPQYPESFDVFVLPGISGSIISANGRFFRVEFETFKSYDNNFYTGVSGLFPYTDAWKFTVLD